MLNPRKVPLKGKPDLTNFSDERLEESLEIVQRLIHAYEAFSDEREMLFRIWKAISDHQIDREAFGNPGKKQQAPTRQTSAKIKPFNKMFKAKPKGLIFQ